MKTRKAIAGLFIFLALILGFIFYGNLEFPWEVRSYLRIGFYNQFGPLAICVELFIAGIHLFFKHSKANFPLALFGFTALLDPLFNWFGLFDSLVPVYASVIFFCFGIIALWLAFSDTFKLGRISSVSAFLSFGLGVIVEIFFNSL